MEDDWEVMGGGRRSRDKEENREGKVLLGKDRGGRMKNL